MSVADFFGEEELGVKKRGEHILVVDDERDVREGLGRLLEMEGYDVTIAENGLVAIDRAKERCFDLVITDLRMPGLGGVETLKGLKQLHPRMPVIVVTAYASDETAARCIREGAYGYVMKPFELDHLLRVIEEAVPTGKAPLQS
jgi:DNA-binding NtrC family response regulator